MLDASCPSVQHRTLVSPASITLQLAEFCFKCRSCFRCRFLHFVASGICVDTHACCRPPVFYFTPCIACFPVVFRLGFVSHYMSYTCIAWFFVSDLFPLCMSYTCIAWFYSTFCFLACIAFRAVMLTVWSSHEPGFARFGTQAALLST